MTDGAVTDGAVTDGAVTDGAVTDGAATDGAATDGAATVPHGPCSVAAAALLLRNARERRTREMGVPG